ncbi:uncharacterized protein LOC107480702 [Arachis duranensis]|uniref:Uncharacterized protein LOC107480702 n=1 Tax=Arachis duranensis TaxID=130453 RepID=A0A6P4CT85_ARADU|nr:uncharacterized protein LOC107480702 [Arachis duranensis]
MHEKLKLIKKNISKWNREIFGNIYDKIRRLESEIAKVEVLLEGNIKEEINLSRRKALVGQLDIWYIQKGEYWKQMSMEKYIKEIDKNTRYFHTMTTIRSRKKLIREIKIGNRQFKDPRRIKNEARKFFKNLYHQDRMLVIRVQEGLVARLSEEQAMQLELMPSYIEVKEAVWSCGSTKAHGPDGFNMFFVKNSWEIIRMEFTESDRQILDGALTASEIVSWLKKSKKSGIIVKLDFKKAYDTVRCSFLEHVLKIMGFGDIWRKSISGMLNTAAMSIIVNGSPSEPFAMERGLRQGDPILPFLFIFVAEVLNQMFTRARDI